MKVYIQTDIEGVSGFCFFENRQNEGIENYYHRQRMRRLLTGEVNAAVLAAFESGAEEVIINDSHGSSYNILFEELDPRCQILHGRAGSAPFWLQDIERGYDVMLLIGMHAMAGTECALLPHSKWVLNGNIFLSEASMAAALAGYYGVKTVFISGDQYVTAEVAEKIPGIVRGVVKEALGPYYSRSRMPAAAQKIIHDGVIAGIAAADSIEPYVLTPPFILDVYDSDRSGRNMGLIRLIKEPVKGDDLVDVFQRAVNSMPWNNFGLKHVDGFKYP
jgi:D-amino peptidase